MGLFFKFFLSACFIITAVNTATVLDPNLKRGYERNSKTAHNVIITFTGDIRKVIQSIDRNRYSSMAKKRAALQQAAQLFTNRIQLPVQKRLLQLGFRNETFWISNVMRIQKASFAVVQAIARFPEVVNIRKEIVFEIESKVGRRVNFSPRRTRVSRQLNLAWGVTRIRANDIWSVVQGRGIVVAGIDTGVRHTHEALRNNWRQNYGWFDPGATRSPLPFDDSGHGSHTMGIIAGQTGTGVAPGVQWIACRGCTGNSCAEGDLIACGQWVFCPTLPSGHFANCQMAPHIVSNSWNSNANIPYYDNVLAFWQTGGIIPVFSMGNTGPACGTVKYPADRGNVISVGNVDSRERISSSSSLGPTTANLLKPEVVAPGTDIPSAWHTADNHYVLSTGTSQACPHVAGVLALILQRKPSLTATQAFNAIMQTTERNNIDVSTAPDSCGGISRNIVPNNVFGYGRINAYEAVRAA